MYKLIIRTRKDYEALRELVRSNMAIARKPLAEAMTLIDLIAEQGTKLKEVA